MAGVDTPILVDWAIVQIRPVDYPQYFRCRFTGIGFGHPRLSDGVQFLTTDVEEVDPDEKWGRTKSRIYNLGRKLEPVDFSTQVSPVIKDMLKAEYSAIFHVEWISVEKWRELVSGRGLES